MWWKAIKILFMGALLLSRAFLIVIVWWALINLYFFIIVSPGELYICLKRCFKSTKILQAIPFHPAGLKALVVFLCPKLTGTWVDGCLLSQWTLILKVFHGFFLKLSANISCSIHQTNFTLEAESHYQKKFLNIFPFINISATEHCKACIYRFFTCGTDFQRLLPFWHYSA